MSKMKRWMLTVAWITSALWGLSAAQALTMDEAKRMAVGESDARVEAISQAVAQGSEKPLPICKPWPMTWSRWQAIK